VKFSIHEAAERELSDAAGYYRERGGPKLAESLLDEFERAYGLLRAYPNIGAIWRKSTRLVPIERFPYSLVYYVMADQVRIVAFAHQRRKSGFWRARR